MQLITVTAVRAIQIKPFAATQGQAMLVDWAIGSYGYLLRSQPPRAYTFAEFADIIAEHYDVEENVHNQAAVDALRIVQDQTEASASLRTAGEPALA